MQSECSEDTLSGLDGLPYEFYKGMPDLFEHLLVVVYANWQQNGRIPKSAVNLFIIVSDEGQFLCGKRHQRILGGGRSKG